MYKIKDIIEIGDILFLFFLVFAVLKQHQLLSSGDVSFEEVSHFFFFLVISET